MLVDLASAGTPSFDGVLSALSRTILAALPDMIDDFSSQGLALVTDKPTRSISFRSTDTHLCFGAIEI